jgi:hypothetical protein
LIVGNHLKLVAGIVYEESRCETEGTLHIDVFRHFAIEALGDLGESTVAHEFVMNRMFFRIAGPD